MSLVIQGFTGWNLASYGYGAWGGTQAKPLPGEVDEIYVDTSWISPRFFGNSTMWLREDMLSSIAIFVILYSGLVMKWSEESPLFTHVELASPLTCVFEANSEILMELYLPSSMN